MKSLAIAVFAATVAMYVWGFLYWGVNPLPYTAWQQTTDDVAAGKALLDMLPTSGTYYIPSPRNDPDTLGGLFEAGPIAFIHFQRQGRPQHDPTIMIRGFFLNLGVVILLAALLHAVAPALPTYAARLKFLVLVALTATVLIDVGAVVWWDLPWRWKLHQAAYDVTAILVPGLVLARLIRPARRTVAPSTP